MAAPLGREPFFKQVLPGPNITTQPADVSLGLRCHHDFSVTAVYTTPPNLFYQWYFNGAPLSDGTTVTGSTTSTLTITDAAPNNAGSYFVIVSDDIGQTWSANASLVFTDAVVFADANLETGVLAALGRGQDRSRWRSCKTSPASRWKTKASRS